MAKVRFTQDFDYRPTAGITIAYKAGRKALTVRRECAEQATAEGKAVWIDQDPDRADKDA